MGVKRAEVVQVRQRATAALALHGFKCRMSAEDWASLVASPVKFFCRASQARLLTTGMLARLWTRPAPLLVITS